VHRLFFGRVIDETATAVAVGATVALFWGCLAASRKWEFERSWIDRLGRLLGATAIATALFAYLTSGV